MITRIKYLFCAVLVLFLFTYLAATEFEGWERNNTPYFTIYHHAKDKEVVELISPQIVQDIENFQKTISSYPDLKARIVISPTRDYYDNLTADFGGIVEFSEAMYMSNSETIYIRNLQNLKNYVKLRQIILHEYIHFFVESRYRDLPLWFNEGMAVYFSGDLTFERELRYARDFLLGNTQTLNEMRIYYPASQIQWESFYAKSGLAIKYLYSNYREGFYQLWSEDNPRSRFSLSFFHAFRMTEFQYSVLLEESLTKRFRIEILLTSSGLIWGVLPLVLLIAWIHKKHRNKKIKEEWSRTELPDFTVPVEPEE